MAADRRNKPVFRPDPRRGSRAPQSHAKAYWLVAIVIALVLLFVLSF